MKKLFPIFFALVFVNTDCLYAQTDTALINELIKDIKASQVKQDGEFYSGMFPSYRKCAGLPHNYQPDNNIFFTAITAFTLNNIKQRLNDDNKVKVQEVIKNAATSYQYYKNPNGFPYYSFWPTHARILPHSFFIKYLNGFLAQGDDADDSAMILMTSDNNDSANTALKERLILLSNLAKRKINSTYKKYRNIPAYSTYLGEKMHPDFDFAVQCNILYFILDKKLPLVKQDSATIYLLAQMLKNREYMKAPVYISPCYVKPTVLIYHVARLMSTFNIAELLPYKAQLIADANHLFSKRKNIMEQIILRTSLLYLGAAAPPLAINSIADFEKTDQNKFVFFQARAAFAQPTPVKQVFLHWRYLIYFFYCSTYNKALLLEYLVLKNNEESNKKIKE